MENANHENLSKLLRISKKSFNDLSNILTLTPVKKGSIVIEATKKVNSFFYLRKGIISCSIKDKDGKSYTKSISKNGDIVTSLKALITKSPSNYDYLCLTDCELLKGNYNDFIKLTKTSKEIKELHLKFLEYNFLKFEKRVIELSTLDATERYLKLKKDIPKIETLIPLYEIASYLNITPVQLSRIRKKIYSI